MIGSYYTSDRIVNLNENKALAENLKCILCKNLLKKPMTCSTCKTNFCRVCLANELLKRNQCPSCDSHKYKQFEKVPRNVINLIKKFKITCKYEGC